MAVAAKPLVEENANPDHPQYRAGLTAAMAGGNSFPETGPVAKLPRPAPTPVLPVSPTVPALVTPLASSAASVGAVLNRRTAFGPQDAGGAIANLPRTQVAAGPTPAVGQTVAILPPKIEPPKTLPRGRNQTAIDQPNPAEFFRRRN